MVLVTPRIPCPQKLAFALGFAATVQHTKQVVSPASGKDSIPLKKGKSVSNLSWMREGVLNNYTWVE